MRTKIPMTTTTRPGSNAARHGTGEIDLGVMIAAHNAFRRDLVKLTEAASRRKLRDPVRRLAISNGWETFKRQLLQHHRAEDACVWPPLQARLSASGSAMSVLDAMESEHALIDPLLAAVDQAFADDRLADRYLGDVIGELAGALTGHLAHEERDTLPLIGQALTTGEWSDVLAAIRARGSVTDAIEMIPWLLDSMSPEAAGLLLASFPPAAAQRYQAEWKPKYDAVPRWLTATPHPA
jgi:iron-sulfur cluster repair protein YtfE (RIC family)